MKRKNLKTLIVDDNDLECTKKKDPTLETINLSKVGFLLSDLESYDLIVYKGRLGQKTLRLRV